MQFLVRDSVRPWLASVNLCECRRACMCACCSAFTCFFACVRKHEGWYLQQQHHRGTRRLIVLCLSSLYLWPSFGINMLDGNQLTCLFTIALYWMLSFIFLTNLGVSEPRSTWRKFEPRHLRSIYCLFFPGEPLRRHLCSKALKNKKKKKGLVWHWKTSVSCT